MKMATRFALGAIVLTNTAPPMEGALAATRHHVGRHHHVLRHEVAHRRFAVRHHRGRYAATFRVPHAGYGQPAYLEPAAPYYRGSSESPPLNYVPSPYDYSPGAIVNRATIRAQAEPGVTSELAPDAKQTPTGGFL